MVPPGADATVLKFVPSVDSAIEKLVAGSPPEPIVQVRFAEVEVTPEVASPVGEEGAVGVDGGWGVRAMFDDADVPALFVAATSK